MISCIHFVGFRDDRYWNAVKVFGSPHYIHRRWDRRAQKEIHPSDVVIFAKGSEKDMPSIHSGDDYTE